MLAHHLPRPAQPALHGIDGNIQMIGRLRRGQFVNVAQDPHHAIDCRQRRDRRSQIAAQLDRKRLLLQHPVEGIV
jgi:hypothetical protein